jgi:hypothetical protein
LPPDDASHEAHAGGNARCRKRAATRRPRSINTGKRQTLRQFSIRLSPA